MSKFSEYLKKLIDESGESISAISRGIGTERTSIHKALKDERVLSYKTVRSLASYLQLSLEERQEFFRLYDMLLQGEDVWRNRSAVSELLNHLSSVYFPSDSSVPQADVFPAVFPSGSVKNGLYEGEFSVLNALTRLLSREVSQGSEVCFQLFLPFGADISSLLIQLWKNGAHFCVDQLFCFPTAADNDCSKSVGMLQQIIPLCLIARDSYRPFYFYEHPESLSVNPLNYYIITPHYLILLSQNLSTALIEDSEKLVHYFSGHFQNLKDHCEPFVSFATTLSDILEVSTSMIDQKGSLCVMPQPCFGRYSTPELIAKYVQGIDGSMQALYDAVLHHFSLVQMVEKNFCTVFSEKGLQYFIETGKISEIPPEYVSALDVPDRLLFLSLLRADIASDKVTGRIARPSVLRIPDYLTLYIDTSGNVWFDTTADFIHGAYYCNIHISEKSVCRAFLDFFQSLSGSQLVYTQEETLHILDEGIRELENRPEGFERH
ncbi:MAG: hypothetical protein LIO76_11350 [Clostridiales bacterium]|nr:hypothetical protein [Clostridiales bacterium]